MNPNRRAPNLGIILLGYQIFNVLGVNNIPSVTLAFVALHSAIYLRVFSLPWYRPSDVCVSVLKVWYRKDYKRLLFAAFEHGDDMHLYYNMVSFIWKGRSLERRFGRLKFLYLTLVFSVLTNITLVALSFCANEYLEDGYDTQCAVGFSGVIFALKVLTTFYEPSYTRHIMGLPIIIPANYAVWVELVLIQLIVPNASFLGHLAGILVGLAYVKGPLGLVLDSIYNIFFGIFNLGRPRFEPRAEPTGYRNNYDYYAMPGMTEEEEQMHRATAASMHENFQPNYGSFHPDVDEIRRRRLDHY